MHDVDPLEIRHGEIRLSVRHVALARPVEGLGLFAAAGKLAGENGFESGERLRLLAAFLEQRRLGEEDAAEHRRAECLAFKAVKIVERRAVVSALHLEEAEAGESAVFLRGAGVPFHEIKRHLLALFLAAGGEQGLREVREEKRVRGLNIRERGRFAEELARGRRIRFFQRGGLRPERAHGEGFLAGFIGILAQVVEAGHVLGGSFLAFVKFREGRKKVLDRTDRGIIAAFLDRFPIGVPRFFRLALLAQCPADIEDGLGHARAAGIFFLEVLHEPEVAVVFLHELERLSGFENPLLVEPGIRLRDPFESGHAFLHLAFVHQGIAEQDAGFAALLMAGIGAHKRAEFLDAGLVVLELLGAIGFAERRVARVLAVRKFPQVVVHRVPGFFELLVERIPHAEPIGCRTGHFMRRIFLPELLECPDSLLVFSGEQKGESLHEKRAWREVGIPFLDFVKCGGGVVKTQIFLGGDAGEVFDHREAG